MTDEARRAGLACAALALALAAARAEAPAAPDVSTLFAAMGVSRDGDGWVHCDQEPAAAGACARRLSPQETDALTSFVRGLPADQERREEALTLLLTRSRSAEGHSDWVEGQGPHAHPTPSGMRQIPAIVLGKTPISGRRTETAAGASERVFPAELTRSPESFNPDGGASRPELPVVVRLDAVPGPGPALPKAAAAAAAAAGTPSSSPAPPSPAKPRKTFEDRASLVASLAFHIAGAWDIASTIYGIKHLPHESEANPVFLKLFGQKNARNIPLITAGWVATHLGVELFTRYLFRKAKAQAAQGHQKRRILLDALALGILGFGVVWHIEAASTWYGPGLL